MSGGYKKLKPEDNPKPFEPGNKHGKGAPISITNQLREILAQDGEMVIKPEHIIKTNDDGSVVIKMPKRDMVAMKLLQWAMSKKGNDSLRAIQLIAERTEGRPHQSTSVDINQPINQIELTDEQVDKILEEMKPPKIEKE